MGEENRRRGFKRPVISKIGENGKNIVSRRTSHLKREEGTPPKEEAAMMPVAG